MSNEQDRWTDERICDAAGDQCGKESFGKLLYRVIEPMRADYEAQLASAQQRIAELKQENFQMWKHLEYLTASFESRVLEHYGDAVYEQRVRAEQELEIATRHIVELERAAVWVPASGHIQSTDSDDTLTVDGRWLVINAGSLKNIAIKLPDGYRLMYRRQPQPDSEV